MIFKITSSIITNVLVALYQPFWFSVLLSVFVLFFYLYAYRPMQTGKGMREAWKAWCTEFKRSAFFRKLFFFIFFSTMILFRTLLNRNLWRNPLSNVMGGWWIWNVNANTGEKVLTTECFENLIMFIPFTVLLFWTFREKLMKQVKFGRVLWISGKITFLCSLSIETLQLILRLGTFQLSDLFYNTLGGVIGGVIYFLGYLVIKR